MKLKARGKICTVLEEKERSRNYDNDKEKGNNVDLRIWDVEGRKGLRLWGVISKCSARNEKGEERQSWTTQRPNSKKNSAVEYVIETVGGVKTIQDDIATGRFGDAFPTTRGTQVQTGGGDKDIGQ